jgi:hypothetical protein
MTEPPLQPLPFRHERVQWAGSVPSRCGLRADGKIESGYCGRELRFRGCRIAGQLIVANVCNECALKFDAASGLRSAAEELAEMLGSDIGYALERARQAFPRYQPKPVKKFRDDPFE